MLESRGSSKSRDALLEKLRERIKDRDRALEVKLKNNGDLVEIVSPPIASDTKDLLSQ